MPRSSRHLRAMKCIVVLSGLLLLLTAAGCTHVRPWERGKLAHPSMATEGFVGPAEEHVHSVQEGAVGGSASAESGCGCN